MIKVRVRCVGEDVAVADSYMQLISTLRDAHYSGSSSRAGTRTPMRKRDGNHVDISSERDTHPRGAKRRGGGSPQSTVIHPLLGGALGAVPPANTSSTSTRIRSLGVTLFDTGMGSFLVTWSSSRGTYVRLHLHRSCDATVSRMCQPQEPCPLSMASSRVRAWVRTRVLGCESCCFGRHCRRHMPC